MIWEIDQVDAKIWGFVGASAEMPLKLRQVVPHILHGAGYVELDNHLLSRTLRARDNGAVDKLLRRSCFRQQVSASVRF